MKFYRENNMNPFASCIPLLLQLPVFISLFYALRAEPEDAISAGRSCWRSSTSPRQPDPGRQAAERHLRCASAATAAKFLFIPDITAQATGVVLVVLLVLYVGSQLASTHADVGDGRRRTSAG